MSESKLFLIDAHAICYRAFFAIKGLTNSKGQATNAVYGFTAALKKILREYEPQYMAVCFDKKGKTRRQEKFAEYKIQRPVMPDDLISQIPLIKEVVAAYQIPILELEGYEADDLIATLARQTREPGIEVVIVSDDKDMFQLVNDHVHILSTRQEKVMDKDAVTEHLGFEPQLIPDYIALAGDSVDNIPGVKGIGEITAKKLLSQFGSLEGVLQHVEEIKPQKAKEAISEQIEMAKLCKELALLEDQAPIDVDLKPLTVGQPDLHRLKTLFTELEFKKFAQEVTPVATTPVISRGIAVHPGDDLNRIVAKIIKEKQFSFFCDPLLEHEDLLADRKIYFSDQHSIYELSIQDLKDLKPLFDNEQLLKITFDIKDQLKRLPELANGYTGETFDVMLAGYLLSPARTNEQISALAWEYIKENISETPGPVEQLRVINLLHPLLKEQLKERDLFKLFNDLEVPLAFVLFQMEQDGVKIDLNRLATLSQETAQKITGLIAAIYQLAGEEFNLNSPKQLSDVLFQKLKLPVIKKTKTGFSTDEGVLQRLSQEHELPAKLLEYRQLAKLKSTYFDAIPKLVTPYDGRVHAHFNQAGTETGRLSSNQPNLQNIPIRTTLGRQIRGAFIPTDDRHVLISADYSQIELRILAHLSKDENLKTAFEKGEDIHAYTAAQIFEVPENAVTDEMRDTAKRVNFGIAYGMSAFGLSKDLEISQTQAQDFIDRYFLRYPAVKTFMDDEIAKCRKEGFVTTILNRRRYIPEINSPNIGVRQFAQRQAINTPVQGSAADLIKLAMIHIGHELKSKGFRSRMIITVHDELVFDALKSEETQLLTLIRERMEKSLPLSIPIVVSIKHGPNWLEMEKV